MARFSVGRGSVRINISDPLRDIAERATRNAAPRTVHAIEGAVDEVVAEARPKWPVGRERHGPKDGEGRPHSRDLLDAEVVLDPTARTVTGRIMNLADYAYKIRTSQNGVEGSPWEELVRRVIKARLRSIANDIGDEIRAGLRANQ